MFQGRETFPLYLQVTYDRRTIFFKSYYFELFAQPKYAFLSTNILQVIDLESGLLDILIDENVERFTLEGLLQQYKRWSVDVLDSCDGSFKQLLAGVFRSEGLNGLAEMVVGAGDGVAGIRLWEEFGRSLSGGLFERMRERVIEEGHPYLPVAAYVWEKLPDGPMCLSLKEWKGKRKEIEQYLGRASEFRGLDVGRVGEGIQRLLR